MVGKSESRDKGGGVAAAPVVVMKGGDKMSGLSVLASMPHEIWAPVILRANVPPAVVCSFLAGLFRVPVVRSWRKEESSIDRVCREFGLSETERDCPRWYLGL